MYFLVHGTDGPRALEILRQRAVVTSPRDPRMLQRSEHVFLQYLSAECIPARKRPVFQAWGTVAFIFRPSVLRGHQGTYGGIGSFDAPTSAARFRGELSARQRAEIEAMCQNPLWGQSMLSHEIAVKGDIRLSPHLRAVVLLQPAPALERLLVAQGIPCIVAPQKLRTRQLLEMLERA